MHRSSSRSAFSLVELITAMAVSGILVGAMGVVLITASSPLETGTGTHDDERVAAEAIADFESDIAGATKFFELSDKAVWFEVPDRNDDGQPEHIRYEWSGKADDPLTRSTNGAPPAPIAVGVQDLSISYIKRPGLTETVSAERLIAEFNTHPSSTEGFTAASSASRVAQIFRPALSADAATWTATRLQLKLKNNTAPDGTLRVSIVALEGANLPGSTTYASADIKESTYIGGGSIVEVSFATCDPIPAGQPVAILIQGLDGAAAAADVAYLASASATMPFNVWMATTTNSGSTWQTYGQNRNLRFSVYGKVTTQAVK